MISLFVGFIISDVASSPLELVMLPESDYPHQKCLDGSQFGYYIRKAPESSPNNKKWVILLQGGGLCVEPIDCYIRRDSDEGSTKTWEKLWSPGTDGAGDITSDDPNGNPNFYDYNHVYLRYCSGIGQLLLDLAQAMIDDLHSRF